MSKLNFMYKTEKTTKAFKHHNRKYTTIPSEFLSMYLHPQVCLRKGVRGNFKTYDVKTEMLTYE